MNANELLFWTIAFSFVCIAVWGLWMFFIPNCLCSLFRYRLWCLRDAVKDDIFHNRLPNNELIAEFLSIIEALIRVADSFTLVRVILLPSDKEEAEKRQQFLTQSVANLEEKSRQRFLDYQKELVIITTKRLFIGSLTGWLFMVLLIPVFLLIFCYRLVKRASISANDLIISTINCVRKSTNKWLKKEDNLDWPEVAGKIMTMGEVSTQSQSSLSKYAV